MHLLVLLLAALLDPGAEADWPTYRGDVRRSGRSAASLDVPRLERSWVHRARRGPSPAWPGPARWDAFAGLSGLRSMRDYDPAFHVSAVGGLVWYASNSEDAVVALDARTGERRWERALPGPVRGAPTFDAGRVLVGCDDGCAYALDAETGAILWSFDPTPGSRRVLNDGRLIDVWPVRTGVVVEDGTAWFGASLLPWKPSFLCAVDAATGTLAGEGPRYVREVAPGATFEGAFALADERLVAPQGRVAPLVFDAATGAALGALEGGGGSFVLVDDAGGVLHGPGHKDGWITDSAASGARVATYSRGNAVVLGDVAAYMLSDQSVSALHRASRAVLWSAPTACPHALALVGDRSVGEVLVLGGDGRVEARDAADGRLVWAEEVEGRALGLAVANGRLLVATDLGDVVTFVPGDRARAPGADPAATEHDRRLGPPPPLRVEEPRDALDHWVFQRDQRFARPVPGSGEVGVPHVANLARDDRPARVLGALDLRQEGELQCAALDGRSGDFEVASDLHAADLPREALSVEAWVRLDRAQAWGGILGALQDNGPYEKGFLLGYRDRRFGFAVNGTGGPDRLHWLIAPTDLELGCWHHVVGTYDGVRQVLFVDGVEVAAAEVERGAIDYPEHGVYHLGAYRDDDEYFRLVGRLHEVRLDARAVPAAEVARRWRAKRGRFPEPAQNEAVAPPPRLELAAAPEITFVGAGRARLTFSLQAPAPADLLVEAVGRPEAPRVVGGKRRRDHVLELAGLSPGTVYRVTIRSGGAEAAPFEVDTHFDFHVARARGAADDTPGPDELAWSARAGVEAGVVLVVGPDVALARTLAAQGEARVVLVVEEADEAARLRGRLLRAGLHGARVSVHVHGAKARLPRAFANRVLARRNQRELADRLCADGLLEALAWYGGEAWLPRGLEAHAASLAGARTVPCDLDGVERHRRGPAPGAGAWTHMYGAGDNSAYGGEALGGARATDDLELAWIGRPGPRHQSDRQNRKPSPLATEGRLFVQGLHRVIALDAANGAVLWSRELPELARFNIPRASSNWAADEDSVYLALGDRCRRVDAGSGRTLAEFPAGVPGDREWGHVGILPEGLLGSAVRAGGHHTRWWGSASWYDAKAGDDAAKVVSEELFLVDPGTGEVRWRRAGGRVIEATITHADGRVWFVETRSPEAKAIPRGRLHEPCLWEDLWLVCLDARGGEVLWEREARPEPGDVAFCMAEAEGTLVLLSSWVEPAAEGAGSPTGGYYALYALDAADGSARWRKKFAWETDHHGKHLSRPTIVGGEVFVRPLALDLETGDVRRTAFPVGHQCGTYVAASEALVLRAGELCLWDRESGDATRWERLRPDCWISTIPACGMLLSPEGGGGCSCGKWIEASMGFRPR